MKKRFLGTVAAVGRSRLLTALFCALFLTSGTLASKLVPISLSIAAHAGPSLSVGQAVRTHASMGLDAASKDWRGEPASAGGQSGMVCRRQNEDRPFIALLTSERQPFIALLTQDPGGEPAVYRAASAPDGRNHALLLFFGGLAAGVCIGLTIALIAVRRLAGRTTALQELVRTARSLEEGGGASPLPDRALSAGKEFPGEWGELYDMFYSMAGRLADAQRSLARNNDRLAGILQGMDDGVIAADPAGNITLITDRARELLGEDPTGQAAGQGENRAAVSALLEAATAAGRPVRDTLFLAVPEERTLQVFAAPLPSATGSAGGEKEGALAVISNITRLTKLEELRSEFVANVTHELKTPLTSIRGYIELLKSGPRDEQTSRSFYEIIEIEAERLQKLTDDLLQLSEIENRRNDTENPPAPLGDSICKAAETLRPEAESRGVRLYLFVDPNLAVRATPRRLYQLIKNLMENAVKYNHDGGAVNVSAHREGNLAVIRVHDTGIGIPPEHRERIFERFYRVDKGRSRELGGTGLGLSIVKHIVSLYSGGLQVDSEAGIGTTFTVRLPAEDV